MQPEWVHLPLPDDANDARRISFTDDDLATMDGTTFSLTASTSDPTKVGIDSSNLPHKVQLHTRQVSAFIVNL